MAARFGKVCKHLLSVLAQEAATEAPEIAEDLEAILAHGTDEGGDGAPLSFECDRVSNAQASWSWEDGEAA